MSTLAIVLIVAAVVLVLLFVGGLAATRRRAARAGDYAAHVAAADRALEEARATDRGWDRHRLEALVKEALSAERPSSDFEALHLVLVDDRPGVREDRAHFIADGPDGPTRVVLTRSDQGWAVHSVE